VFGIALGSTLGMALGSTLGIALAADATSDVTDRGRPVAVAVVVGRACVAVLAAIIEDAEDATGAVYAGAAAVSLVALVTEADDGAATTGALDVTGIAAIDGSTWHGVGGDRREHVVLQDEEHHAESGADRNDENQEKPRPDPALGRRREHRLSVVHQCTFGSFGALSTSSGVPSASKSRIGGRRTNACGAPPANALVNQRRIVSVSWR
jgi:hypothetical protein